VAIFCQTKRIFVGRSSATVKKICEVWKMGLFGPDSAPPNQLQINSVVWKRRHQLHKDLRCSSITTPRQTNHKDILYILSPPKLVSSIAYGQMAVHDSFLVNVCVSKGERNQLQKNKVVVYCKEVPNPVAVRFGWFDSPEEANLFNAEGLPASPFRTDHWTGLTAGKTYGN
jgi:hypothetical protein